MTTNEGLRAVEMTRRIRDQMYEETKNLGAEELIRYIKQRSDAASRRIEAREAIGASENARMIDR